MNTTNTAPAIGTSQQDAATQIASLLSVEEDGTQAGGEAEGDDEGQQADDTVDAGETDEGSEADDGEEPESGEEDDDEGNDEQELTDATEIQIGDEKVTLHELKRGFLREADYTRKTQALAEERKQHTAAAQVELDGLRNERAAYVQQLGEVQRVLEQLKPQEPDWNELYQTDPAQYAAQREMWRSYNDQQVQLHAEQQNAIRKSQEDFQRELAAFVKEEGAKLIEKLPEWKQKETRDKFVAWGVANGFSAEEMGNLTDHRAVLTAHKAMLYDELMAKKKAMKPVPVTQGQPKTAKPGNAATAPNRTTEATRARQRLAKTGKVGDAASAILHLLPED